MFKSSFSKYLTALTIIILVGFLMLSAIIISIIRAHTTEDKEKKLELACTLVADRFEDAHVENLESYILNDFGTGVVTLIPLISLDYDFNILITNEEGDILLTTFIKNDDNSPVTGEGLGHVDLNAFDKRESESGEESLIYNGRMDEVTDERALVYGVPVITKDVTRGYVLAVSSQTSEDKLIGVTRQAVINGSIWVMMASLVAAYFITDRIVHPLKSMTSAAKKFAKGDFSERIVVSGSDEVAALSVAFNNMAESLANLEKMRNTFLASVSHDLRTPMTTISGYIDGITSGAIPDEKRNHYLSIIQTEVHRLSRLVSLLLDVSRLDSGDRKFTFESFNIAEMSRLILVSFESKIYQKKLEAEFICDEDDVFAYGDKDAIHQVIYNLCHNAIKFADEGGSLIIKLKSLDEKTIRFSVYDDGQKISPDEAANVFDRFYKSDKSRGLDKEGVGLGLYICKTIIDAHSADIGVDIRDNGCEFYFTIQVGEATRGTRRS